MTREVTETTSLICSPQASLEMVLMKPLVPRLKKKPLIGQTHADRANVGNIDKPNAEIVALRDDRSDIAKGTEPQIDDVAKIERDEASEAKTDAVAENRNGEVPQECDSKADVEQSPEALEQRQPQQLSSATVGAPDRDAAECVQQRTAEQVIDVPDDAGTSVQQRTAEQVVDDAGTEAQQQTVVEVVDETTATKEVVDETTATKPLDREPLDETQRVERLAVRAKAAPREGSLSRAVRLELERVQYEQAAQRRYKRARARSAERKAL